jgi:hypothetical protein
LNIGLRAVECRNLIAWNCGSLGTAGLARVTLMVLMVKVVSEKVRMLLDIFSGGYGEVEASKMLPVLQKDSRQGRGRNDVRTYWLRTSTGRLWNEVGLAVATDAASLGSPPVFSFA